MRSSTKSDRTALTALRFAPVESTRAYLEALREHVLAYGRPLAFYSDRHGIFRVNAKDAASGDGRTEFGRVAARLDIASIHALTPQAKGRVERANQTVQDRLVKELRLMGISATNSVRPSFALDGTFEVIETVRSFSSSGNMALNKIGRFATLLSLASTAWKGSEAGLHASRKLWAA